MYCCQGFHTSGLRGVSGFSGLSRISDLAFFWIFQNFSRFLRISLWWTPNPVFPPCVSLSFFRNREQNFFCGVCTFFAINLYVQLDPQKKHEQIAVHKIHRIEHFGIIALELPCARHSCGKTGRQKGCPDFSGFFRIFPDFPDFFCPRKAGFVKNPGFKAKL